MRLLRKFRYRFFKIWIKQNRSKFKHHVYLKKLRGGLKAGYTEAKIVSTEKLENERVEKNFITAVPIINCRISNK